MENDQVQSGRVDVPLSFSISPKPSVVSPHSQQRKTPSLPADEGLLSRATEGDRAAFEAIYRAYRQDLLNFVGQRYRSLDAGAVEDVVSEVFVLIWRRERPLRITQDARSYLKRMAMNVVAGRLRGRTFLSHQSHAEVPSSALSPETILDQKELAHRIAQALETLTQSYRLALKLSQQGLSAKQIASLSDCTERAAQRRVEKAREQLKLALSHCGRGCVIQTDRRALCPAHTKNYYCLKWLYMDQLRGV